MARALKLNDFDKQTELIVKALCDEINAHNEEFSLAKRSGSFAKSLLHKNRGGATQHKHTEYVAETSLQFEMDDIDPESQSQGLTDALDDSESEVFQSESQMEDSFNETEALEQEAIEAIISAIHRMAMKIDKDPKISTLLQETSKEEESSNKNFGIFNSMVRHLLNDITPGISVDSWGNAIFLMIIALKVSKLKSYPQDFFKKYVYDKIVPWVTKQPDGWASVKYDEKVGNVVRNELNKKPSTAMHRIDRSGSSPSDYASSPSSLLSWFTFPRPRSYNSSTSEN